MQIPTITLRDGMGAPYESVIPQLGMGTYKIPDAEVQAVVETGLELGYRHVDTATMYNNEPGVGRALRAANIPREEIFLTSKLDNPDHDPAAAHAAIHRSLEWLDVEYLDLYLIHWPLSRVTDVVSTWGALIEMWQAGLVRQIGVSNFTATDLKRIMAATGLVPAVNQIEANPYFGNNDLRAFHAEQHIVTQAWSPLGRGGVIDDLDLAAIAEAAGCTPAQAVIAWHLQRGDVVIPKSTHRARLAENLAAAEISLTFEQIGQMGRLERGQRSGSSPDEMEARFIPG